MRVAFVLLVPIVLVALVAFSIYGLTPPTSIRLATGAVGGGYWQLGEIYKTELARDGIAVELVETKGSIENIQRLVSGDTDVAFVQGGLNELKGKQLESLGAIFPEPVVIFRHTSVQLSSNPGEWRGVRLAAGLVGSGTRAAASALIKAAGLQDAGISLVAAGGSDAIAELHAGAADALLFVSPLDAPYLMDAIFDPDLIFVPMGLIDALALSFPGSRAVTIPAGSITLDPPRPPQEVDILTLTASMIGAFDLHPAVADRLVHASFTIHGNRNVLQEFREYPNTNSPPVPINEVAWHLINSGPSFLHEFLPYWVAAQFGRVVLLVLPLLFLAPLLRIIPAAYVWYQKRRVWRYYQQITALETELDHAFTRDEVETLSKKFEDIDLSLSKLKLPLAYRQDAYDARLHIDLIRQEVARRHQ